MIRGKGRIREKIFRLLIVKASFHFFRFDSELTIHVLYELKSKSTQIQTCKSCLKPCAFLYAPIRAPPVRFLDLKNSKTETGG